VPSTAQLSGGAFDDGRWQAAGPAGVGAPLSLAIDPQRPDHLYLATDDGVYMSRDEGRTWAVAALPGLVAFALHPGEPRRLFAATATGGGQVRLWRSEDRGTSWRPGAVAGPAPGQRGSRLPRAELALDPVRPDRLYLAAVFSPPPAVDAQPVTRLWASRDAGDSVLELPLPGTADPAASASPPVPGLAVLENGTLLAATGTGVHRRPPDSAGWQPGGEGLGRRIVHLAVGAGNRTVLYAATAAVTPSAPRTFRSTDGGDSWQRFGIDLPAGPVSDLVPDPRDRHQVWAAVAGAGVFHTRGGAWAEVTPGLPSTADPELLAIAPGRRKILWVATPGGDLFRRAPPPPGCVDDADTLCLAGRFRIDVDPADAGIRADPPVPGPVTAHAVPLTRDGGWFWFARPEHPEVVVRATLAGPRAPGMPPTWRVYAGSLSSRPFDLRIYDVESGLSEILGGGAGNGAGGNGGGGNGGGADATLVATFPAAASQAQDGDLWFAALPEGGCGGDSIDLCLHQRRFEVTVDWRDGDGAGGAAVGDRLSDAAGWFRFFQPSEPELVVKIVDARQANGHWQVAFASLGDLGFELTVTDQHSGEAVVYDVSPGAPSSHLDATAIPDTRAPGEDFAYDPVP